MSVTATSGGNKRARMDGVCSDQTLKSWSRSHSDVIRLEHTWIVENFSLIPQKKGASLFSPIFSDQ